MKSIFALMISLMMTSQAFAAGTIFSQHSEGTVKIRNVLMSLERFDTDITISAYSKDRGYRFKVDRSVIKSMNMDLGSFMTLLTSADTSVVVACLDAEVISGERLNHETRCHRLAINAEVPVK